MKALREVSEPIVGPDCLEGSLPKILTADPDIGMSMACGLIGIKWIASDGNQYGEVLYLPPLVYRFFKAHMRPEFDIEKD